MQVFAYFQAYLLQISIVLLIINDPWVVIGLRQSLFASLSQLQLLWHNDKYIVKIMERILETPSAEYRPLQRCVM